MDCCTMLSSAQFIFPLCSHTLCVHSTPPSTPTYTQQTGLQSFELHVLLSQAFDECLCERSCMSILVVHNWFYTAHLYASWLYSVFHSVLWQSLFMHGVKAVTMPIIRLTWNPSTQLFEMGDRAALKQLKRRHKEGKLPVRNNDTGKVQNPTLSVKPTT